MTFFTAPFLAFLFIHATLMLFDEFYFHRKRRLGLWERIGHPVDTFFTLICFILVLFFSMSKNNILIYLIFSIISCLIIIKDEGVHLQLCNKNEQFIHAVLFVCHPLVLLGLFLCWPSFSSPAFPSLSLFSSPLLKKIITLQFISIILFFFYQIFYWNFYQKVSKIISITTWKEKFYVGKSKSR